MAEKFKPGIPSSFSLNVEPVRDLGDYLDEPPPTVRLQHGRLSKYAKLPSSRLKRRPR